MQTSSFAMQSGVSYPPIRDALPIHPTMAEFIPSILGSLAAAGLTGARFDGRLTWRVQPTGRETVTTGPQLGDGLGAYIRLLRYGPAGRPFMPRSSPGCRSPWRRSASCC